MPNAKITVQKNEMQNKSYTLSGTRAFLYRYADTGFRTKWCGIWAPPYKLFEYFAFKVNETWLSPENASKFSLEKETAEHSFSIGGIDVREITFVQRKMPTAVIQLNLKNTENAKKSVCIELEAAANMRTKFENFHKREYETNFVKKTNAVIMKSCGICAAFGLGKIEKKAFVEFSKNGVYREHSPGGELQRCFIPGSYKVTLELKPNEECILPFVFAGAISDKENIAHNYEICFHDAQHSHLLKHSSHGHTHSEIITPDKELNDAFAFSASNVNGLIHESAFGKGFFAGYPWFLEFWGRDTFWSIYGLVDLGEFAAAKEILATFAKFQKDRIPCLINLDSSAKYYAADVDALFICALDYYIKQSGDYEAEEDFSQNIEKSKNSLCLKDGFAKHKTEETWMDSLSRDGTAIEIQSLWIEALKKRTPKTASKMRIILHDFLNKETKYLNDTGGDFVSARITSNALMPLMFEQLNDIDAEVILETAKKELLGPYGIATLSKSDKSYGPAKYHEGASWDLTSAIGACAFLKYGKINEGVSCLKAMAADSKRHTLGGMSECLNSETGELIGCGMQLWSAALFVHAIDAYLFGISLEKDIINIDLKLPAFWKFMERKNKKLGNTCFDLSVSMVRNRCEIHINFKNTPKNMRISVSVQDIIDTVQLNGRPIKELIDETEPDYESPKRRESYTCVGKTIGFIAEKSNSIMVRTM
ncbi:MAG: amylo-alpha-1,6-glucosidase [Nanoarchaeota archaeon]|nr:hypothetical protein [Nanoarchaeota archaeon]MCG2723640.1 hypothetical protein [archaeon]